MRRHPVLSFAILAIVPTWALQFLSLAMGWDLMPAKIAEIIILLGAATLVTAVHDGRAGLRRLYAVKWRIGLARFAVLLLAMPVSTLTIAAVSGSMRTPDGGWLKEVLGYLFLTLVWGALLGNIWEETAWAGFAQTRLITQHGLLRGSFLTAIPFALIHLPLAFEEHGLSGTSGRDLAITWTVLVLTAPVFRYLFGMTLLDTGGSVIAVAVLHASFNASQNLASVHGWWPAYVALPLLTLLTALWRRRASSKAGADDQNLGGRQQAGSGWVPIG